MTLRIAEIFGPTIQGEGPLIGEPTVFVRAGGCDYRCVWCDSLHAVESRYRHEWQPMEAPEVMERIERLSGGRPLLVSISGGNPAIQDFGPLIALGKAKGYRFACETQGTLAPSWFADLHTLVLSPKPPSSGMETDWKAFEACLAAKGTVSAAMKIVVFDDVDLEFARDAADRHPELPLFLQPGNAETDPARPVDLDQMADRLAWLVDETVGKGWLNPRILPQLHVIVWGNRRGV